MLYQVHDIGTAAVDLAEPVGTKEKFWFRQNNERWLFKYGREETGEDWAEKVCYELASLIGIPCARYELATFEGRRGVISPSVVPNGSRLVLGNELLARYSEEYEAYGQGRWYQQRTHTVSLVFNFLEQVRAAPPPGWLVNDGTAVGAFLGYLMLDALVGNTDRHHENWGLIASHEEIWLAPTFDHASSLGRELSDSNRTQRLTTNDRRASLPAYVGKARSGFYEKPNDKRPLSCLDAYSVGSKIAADWMPYWRKCVKELSIDIINPIFEAFPPGWISCPAKTFAKACIVANRDRILENGNGSTS